MGDTDRLPTYFVSHGGGPWPWIKDQLPGDWGPLERSLQAIPRDLGRTPRAVLCVTAHWETDVVTVGTGAAPPMLYDYGGFPDFTYRIQYPAPGSPEVAQRTVELLDGAGIAVRTDDRRGFDHGTFVPLFVAWPDADVPVVQLSIRRDFDPEFHVEVGRALAPLRDEDVLILGSGFTFHNLPLMFGGSGAQPSREFDDWIATAMLDVDPDERTRRLLRWEQAPSARIAHPAEDHLIPLMVAVGAAEDERAERVYHQNDFFQSISSSSYRFGPLPARVPA